MDYVANEIQKFQKNRDIDSKSIGIGEGNVFEESEEEESSIEQQDEEKEEVEEYNNSKMIISYKTESDESEKDKSAEEIEMSPVEGKLRNINNENL